MNWLWTLFAVSALSLVGLAVAMRLVPSDPARWHVLPPGAEPGTGAAQAVRVIDGDRETLAELDAIARAHPRTTHLAGSVEEGKITYVTRSTVFGFPDYTTVGLREGQIVLFARLRFGKSDLGVNAARLDAWLTRLAQ
ncbi:DUF1499 domain-containing protein [Roseovarius aestuariivivens]|uniref:DUF1499 domain-containing protein n=1 Tax=Roseovarius aestuariivivens TaxID=1888910 RepID=UPI001081762D|nr:DUF1499 domain-containing protein [Roseovarius aestuariivivens]